MTDPVTRAAKRQNLIDRLAEHLVEWGCPADSAPTRAGALLITVEAGGWSLPSVDAPPLSGRGSTDEGRARARRIMVNSRAGCTCSSDESIAAPPERHPVGCPARLAPPLEATSC